ncbi:MAG TPA: LuxR C-terminal-related transcriptional regulator [Nevskiaceae bacterium]|nr:LuxR C-terminal-related transcriptional regulator [Nevskiaceae bacterium]
MSVTPSERAPIPKDIDRLIQSLYALAMGEDWEDFRHQALAALCQWLGASAAAWLTRSEAELPGEFSSFPAGVGFEREQLQAVRFPAGVRELALDRLPGALAGARGEGGWVFEYVHRNSSLISTVLLRFPAAVRSQDAEAMRRAVGHMVEAGGLALRHYIQRDEWLHALGRPNRGTAALVDGHGTLYAASQRFQQMLEEQYGPGPHLRLPTALPEAVMEGESSSFFDGRIHFRIAPLGPLFLLHARRPLPLDGLSPREQEIARALGAGKTFKSVARQYDIAVSTVANHASRIYKKLGIYRREDLVDLVRRPGVSPAGNGGRRPH